MDTLIDAAALRDRLALNDRVSLNDRVYSAGESGQRTVLLDVRWALGDPHGHDNYLRGHIPGAIFVDLATELAGPPDPLRGRHPLPAREQFQESARGWGINDGDAVVAYDDSGNMAAARLWWMLRNAGFHAVHLLDGGLAAWRAAGFGLATGPEQSAPGNVRLSDGAMPVIDAGQAASWGRRGLLLDARAGERYRGDVEPVDPRAGHIPGAVSAPTADNVQPDGRFLPPAELRKRFELLGYRAGVPAAVYCGSGVTAAHEIAALEIAGLSAALYPGSFSEWCHGASNDVVTGPAPYGGDTAAN